MANTEQIEELEVLNSIFPTEFESLLDEPPTFKIHLCPNPGGNDNHVAIALNVQFPVDYPEKCPPILNIELEKGLGESQAEEIQGLSERIAVENIGIPVIYMVTEALKEWLIDNNIAGQDGSMYADMLRRIQQKEVEIKKVSNKAAITAAADSELKAEQIDPEELERTRKRQAGTQVTIESFLIWKAAFDEEMLALKKNQLRNATGYAGKQEIAASALLEESMQKMTGKQWFLTRKYGDANEEGSLKIDEEEELIMAGEAEEITTEDIKVNVNDIQDDEEEEEEIDDDVEEQTISNDQREKGNVSPITTNMSKISNIKSSSIK